MDKNTTGIYSITNPIGQVYIGQSWDIERRWKCHRSGDRNCLKLITSLKEYGHDNHLFNYCHALPSDIAQSVMNSYEQLYMDLYRLAGIELLNLREGGGRGKHSEESKLKMSKVQKGKFVSDEARKNMSIARMGIKIHPDSIKKSALSRTGLKRSLEATLKSAANRKGQKRSIEAKLKMSLAQKGKPWSAARREAQNKKSNGFL